MTFNYDNICTALSQSDQHINFYDCKHYYCRLKATPLLRYDYHNIPGSVISEFIGLSIILDEPFKIC